MIRIHLTLARLFLTLALVAISGRASGQAYCALRDPSRDLLEMYPSASGHRSIVRTIDADTRSRVLARSGVEMHFNELGRHTLYIAQAGATPIGLVHVRAEQGRWGLTEIAWSLDFDLTVRDFRFQRCREAGRAEVEGEAFKALLRGRSQLELQSMLDSRGRLDPAIASQAGIEHTDLAGTILRCAIKTQAVTREAWSTEVCDAFVHALAASALGGSRVVALTSASTDEREGRESDEVTALFHVLDVAGEPLGWLAKTRLSDGPEGVNVFWPVTRAATLLEARPEWGTFDKELRANARELVGKGLEDLEECLSALDVAGRDALEACLGDGP